MRTDVSAYALVNGRKFPLTRQGDRLDSFVMKNGKRLEAGMSRAIARARIFRIVTRVPNGEEQWAEFSAMGFTKAFLEMGRLCKGNLRGWVR